MERKKKENPASIRFIEAYLQARTRDWKDNGLDITTLTTSEKAIEFVNAFRSFVGRDQETIKRILERDYGTRMGMSGRELLALLPDTMEDCLNRLTDDERAPFGKDMGRKLKQLRARTQTRGK